MASPRNPGVTEETSGLLEAGTANGVGSAPKGGLGVEPSSASASWGPSTLASWPAVAFSGISLAAVLLYFCIFQGGGFSRDAGDMEGLLAAAAAGGTGRAWSARGFKPVTVDWESVPRGDLRAPAGNLSRKWVVVTSINPPTEAIQRLLKAASQGWQLVVVGDTKSPKEWVAPPAIFLSVEDQANLGLETFPLTPFRSYARKNIGYLYAVQHGAQIIYDTDDDNILLDSVMDDPVLGFQVGKKLRTPHLLYKVLPTRNVVNPYVHFGQPTMWPRGLPLDAIADNGPEASYGEAGPGLRPLIQQGLANGDPDVDAIFRLSRTSRNVNIRVNFDSKAPPVALPPGLLAPCNSQNTLFLRDALWGMRIPITTTFRVCDIWRGYWAQRLLWELGGSLTFYPPSVRQDRNVHDYFVDYLDEDDVYKDARRLVDFLAKWKSTKPLFFDRALDLANDMVVYGFWKPKDAELTAAWLKDLLRAGYEPPIVVHSVDDLSQGKEVTFVPRVLETSTLTVPKGSRR